MDLHFGKRKKAPPQNFATESGGLDVQKLLETNRDLLPIAPQKKGAGGETSGGAHQVALPMAMANAALRKAQELSESYAPQASKEAVQQMAVSAQYNLGIEAAHGMQMSAGGAGTTPTPYGPRSDDGVPKKKK